MAKKKTPVTKPTKSKTAKTPKTTRAAARESTASKSKTKAPAAPDAAADTMAKKTPTKKKSGGTKSAGKKTTAAASAAAAAFALSSRRANGESGANQELSVSQLKRAKSDLSRKEKRRYRELLIEKRVELLGDVESLQSDAKNNGGDISHMPVHMADVGSDYYEQEFTLGLVESERKLLREIDEALIRINEGYFGVCLVSGRPIGKARLDAKPWAKYCIEVVRERERQGKW